MTIIDLLRHGEAAPGLCLGRDFDAPLTELGWAQMRGAMRDSVLPWDGVLSSPSARCGAFAGELAGRHGLPWSVDPRFRELGFGAWEGRSWGELYAEEGDRLLDFQRDPLAAGGLNPAPGGEGYGEFDDRIGQAWADLLKAVGGGHWLLVAHAGVIRTILRRVLGFPSRRLFAIQVPYAGLTRIAQEEGDSPRLVFHAGGLSCARSPSPTASLPLGEGS